MQVGKFFAAQNKAPDIASAVAAVSLHKADAVFAPESQGKGLKKLFDVRDRVPEPRVLRGRHRRCCARDWSTR